MIQSEKKREKVNFKKLLLKRQIIVWHLAQLKSLFGKSTLDNFQDLDVRSRIQSWYWQLWEFLTNFKYSFTNLKFPIKTFYQIHNRLLIFFQLANWGKNALDQQKVCFLRKIRGKICETNLWKHLKNFLFNL